MILDTNAVSALLVGDLALGEVLAADQRHHLPVIVIGEYRYGLLGSNRRDPLQKLLEILIRESFVLAVDETTARRPPQPTLEPVRAKKGGRFRPPFHSNP